MSVNSTIISPLSLSNEDLKVSSSISSNSSGNHNGQSNNSNGTGRPMSGGGSSSSSASKVSGLISTFSSKPMSSIHQQHSHSDQRSTIEREKKDLPSGSTKYLTTSFEVDGTTSSKTSSNNNTIKSKSTLSITASSSPPSSDKNTMELLDLICNLPVIPSQTSTPSTSISNSPKPTTISTKVPSPSPSPVVSSSNSNSTNSNNNNNNLSKSTNSTNNIVKSTSTPNTPNNNIMTPDRGSVRKQQSMLNVSYSKKEDLTVGTGSNTLESPRILNYTSPSLLSKTPSSILSPGSGSPSITAASATPPPLSIPLVVKKTSIDRSNWKSTIIQGKEDNIKVIFDSIPGAKRIIQKFSIDTSGLEIKNKIFEELGPEYSNLQDQYEFKVLSLNISISNETLPLRRQLLMQACNISRIFPKLHLVPKSTLNTSSNNNNEVLDLKGHIQAELEIFELIGSSFQRTLESAQDEATSFRRDFAKFRLESFNTLKNNIPQLVYVCSEPMPTVVPSRLVLVVILPGADNGQKITKKIDATPKQSIGDIKQQIFRKFTMIDRIHTRDKTADDFVLKVAGFREYILSMNDLGNLSQQDKQKFNPTGDKGDFALIDYDHIRQCIGKQQQIQLTFIESSFVKSKLEEEKISFIDKILENTDDNDDILDDESSNSNNNSTGNLGNLLSTSNSNNSNSNSNKIVRTNSFIESNNNSPPLSRSTSSSSFENNNNNNSNSNNSNNNSNNSNNNISAMSFLNSTNNNINLMSSKYLPINKVNRLFRVKVVGLKNLSILNNDEVKSKIVDSKTQQASLFIMIEIYYGGELIANPEYSPIIPINTSQQLSFEDIDFPDWEKDVWTPFKISIRSLPRAARACFTVYLSSISPNESIDSMEEVIQKYSIPIGWTNCQLIDHRGHLRTGLVAFKLWEDGRRANPIGTCVDNLSAKTPFFLLIEFESFIKPIVFIDNNNNINNNNNLTQNNSNNNLNSLIEQQEVSPNLKSILEPEEAKRLHGLMQSDPLVKLTSDDKKLIYNYRHIYRMKPKSLAKFLMSVNWVESEQKQEAYKQISEWTALKPVQALELLDAKFPDEAIRTYAIDTIDSFSDSEFSDYLLQLTQVLKYEPYHNSRLTKILIQRALSSPSRIGHFFFWFLKSEMHTPEIEERYGLLLEGYLRSCGSHRQDLLKQNQVIKSLYQVAMAVKQAPSSSEKKKVLHEGLSKIKFPESSFQLPLDPRWEAKGLIVDKCKYMDSKKLPLWLVFENAEANASPLTVIFKAGDDLRQDILTLQVLRVMDKFWKNHGMDLRLQPYKCIATGDGIGMIEVVLNANTIANINKDAGGTGALLEEKTLVNWLKECNPNEIDFNKAVETFILSCAGYVVATYVMGIGDRHADNIMITKHGHLFHIDFGHFLGNYKKKYGFKRERAPFIFTPQYMAIVGGKDSENFKRFVDTCCTAYNILRKNSDLFINLFQLMLSTGIPELQCAEDIDYLRKALAPDLKDEEAAEEFTKNIIIALNTKTVLLNDLFHNWRH